MKIRNTITKLITITMAVAAMAVIGSIWTTQAQHVRVFDGVTFAAVVPGQAIRLSVGNTAESATNRFVYMYYTVSNPSGVPLYESGRIQVPPREFRFSDVSRRDLNTEGEPGTGRAQVMDRFSKIPVQVKAGVRDVVVAFVDRPQVETSENLQKLQPYGGLTGGAGARSPGDPA